MKSNSNFMVDESKEKRLVQSALELNNVLVTSASSKIPLLESVKKSINKIDNTGKLVAGDSNDNCLAPYFADSFWKMPRIDQLLPNQLLAYCKEKKITAIIPTRDGELEYFSKIKTDFADENIGVMISDEETIINCIDKLLFFQHSDKNKLPVIPTYLNSDDINGDRLVVKERFGAGSNSIGINLIKADALEHSLQLSDPVFQPYIVGKEISVDMYINRHGAVQGLVMRTRDEVVNGESRVTTTFYDENIAKLCLKFAKAFSFYGHVILQAILEANGNIHIIECNPRFGGASTLSVFSGLDSFYWFFLESKGLDISDYPFIFDKNKTIRQVRFLQDKIIIVE